MAFLDDLKSKVDELIYLELNMGVSPVELASNIYEEDYNEVKIKKQFGNIHCSVQFYDAGFFYEKKIKHEYRYIYDSNNYLQEIQHVVNKKIELLWSRTEERTKLLDNIYAIASCIDRVQLVNIPVEKLPEDVRTYLKFIL